MTRFLRHTSLSVILSAMSLFLPALVFIVFCTVHGSIAWAQTTPTITILGVTGGSFKTPDPTVTSSTLYKIYGAYASTANDCTSDSAGVGMKPCNPDVITGSSTLSITFSWNKSDTTGSRLIMTTYSASTTEVAVGTTATYVGTGVYTLSVPWSDIEAKMSCSGGFSGTCGGASVAPFNLKIGIENSSGLVDSTNGVSLNGYVEFFDGSTTSYATDCGSGGTGSSGDAICYFKVFPGDKKMYFDDVGVGSGFPTSTSGNSGYKGFQIYFKESNGNDLATMQDMTNKDDSTFVSMNENDDLNFKLTDLNNDVKYCIIIAGITQAGTTMRYYPNPSSLGASDTVNFCETPAQVYGLLENKKCFVATAAFGSELDPHVQRFRDFRNAIMMRSYVGRVLTQFYYAHSPKYARMIADQPALKSAVRGVLWVMLLFVELSLKFGLLATFLGSLFGLLLIYRLVEHFTRHRKSQILATLFLASMTTYFLFTAQVSAQTKSKQNVDTLSPGISSGPDFGSEALQNEQQTRDSQKKVKKKQDNLVDQEVEPGLDNQAEAADAELPVDLNTPLEPDTTEPALGVEENARPQLDQDEVVNEERKNLPSFWERPTENKVVHDLIQKEDGVHYYKVKKLSDDRHSTNFKIGFMPPPAISNRLTDSNGNETVVTYKDMYPSPTVIPVGLYEYEWSPIANWTMLKANFGIGAFYAQGNGRFADGREAREKYTFIGIPTFAGVKLRMQFSDGAWLVPYVGGGGSYFGLAEFRDDGQKRNLVGTPAAYGAGGLMFDMTRFDRETSWIFDRDYDISHLWLTAELRIVKSFSKELDFSSNIIFVGLSADY